VPSAEQASALSCNHHTADKMLFTLPKEMVFKFLTEWLSPSDLCLLDSALNEKALRNIFHDMLSHEQFVLTQQRHGVVEDHALLDFIFRRGVRVEAVRFDASFPDVHEARGYFQSTKRAKRAKRVELFQQFLELRGGWLKYCESRGVPSAVLRTIVRTRPALEEFQTAFWLHKQNSDAEEGQNDLVRALSATLRRLALYGTDYEVHSTASLALLFKGEHALTHLNSLGRAVQA
jgi:hypothetical protein